MAIEAREKNLLTVKDVAAYLQVNQTTIYRLLRRAQIPAFKLGGDWRFNLESIDRWRLDADAGNSREHIAPRGDSRARSQSRSRASSRGEAIEMPAALARVHRAISQTVAPITELHAVIPIIKRIAEAIDDRRDATEEIARLYQGQIVPFRADASKLFEFAPMPFAVVDRKCRVVSFNDSYCAMFGLSPKQLRAVVLTDLVGKADRDRAIEAHRQLLMGEAQANSFVGRVTAEGAPIIIRSRAWAVRHGPSEMPEFAADVLERAATENEASSMVTRCAEDLSKRREKILSRG